MFYRKPLLGIAAVSGMLLSSCKKDLVTNEETVAVVSSDVTANDVHETAAPLTKAITTYVSADCAGYYEVLPARYSLTTKNYPFILFIHGIGELGTGVGRLTCCGLPYYANKKQFPAEFVVNNQHFSYIVMAPQFRRRPTAAQIQEIFEYAKRKYRIDQTRMYIAGLSMGGGSTWDYSAVYGKNVAAAVPICGGTAPTTSLAAGVASSGVPIWTISSKSDAVVPISWATNWVGWIKSHNSLNAANIKLTVYTSGESHNTTWTKATNPSTTVDGYNIYSWMLRYQRVNGRIVTMASGAAPPPTGSAITPNAGVNESINLSWNYSPYLNATLSKTTNGWFTSAKWIKVSGPAGCSIASASSISTRVKFTTAGTYVFRVMLVDNGGATAYADKKITVLPSSGSFITVDAGNDERVNLSWNYSPYLNATSSKTTNGWFTSARWTKVDGPSGYSIASPTSLSTRVRFTTPGTYVFRATLVDNKGATAYADKKIIVLP